MARTERVIEASPEAVFDVLSDPRGYAYWVLGSVEIRAADGDWPAPGSRFHHTVGVGPLRIEDQTRVEESRPGRFLQLETRAGLLGTARVKLELEAEDRGTRVTMVEDPADKPTAFVFMPLTHLLMRGRNARSLERLSELAEGRTAMPGDEPGAPVRALDGGGAVQNPKARGRRTRPRAIGALAAAAAAGALVLGAVLAWRRRGS